MYKEARLEIKASGFWIAGYTAYFDNGVFDLNSTRYKNNSIIQCYAKNEMEKKCQYNDRILQVESILLYFCQ